MYPIAVVVDSYFLAGVVPEPSFSPARDETLLPLLSFFYQPAIIMLSKCWSREARLLNQALRDFTLHLVRMKVARFMFFAKLLIFGCKRRLAAFLFSC
jgi:hypothetical protein